jgi:hypothetical protein
MPIVIFIVFCAFALIVFEAWPAATNICRMLLGRRPHDE